MKNISVTNETTWQDEVAQQLDAQQVLIFSSILELDIYFSNEEGQEIKHNFKNLDDLCNFCEENAIYFESLIVDIQGNEGEAFEAVAVDNLSSVLKDALTEKFGY